ncbi:MAG: glycosyltransferase, partial [Bradyrhizobium sp.]
MTKIASAVAFVEPKSEVYGGQYALIHRCIYLKKKKIGFSIIHPFAESKFAKAAAAEGLGEFLVLTGRKGGSAGYLAGIASLAYFLVRNNPKLLHLDGSDSCYLACFLKMCKLIDGKIVFTLRSERYHRFNWLDRMMLPHVDQIITNSDYSKQQIQLTFDRDVKVHYSPIDFDSIVRNSGQAIPKSDAAPRQAVISYVGSLEPRKNLAFFVDVAKFLRRSSDRYVFHVYGATKNKDQERYVESIVATLDDEDKQYIRFMGYVRIDQAITETDLLLCPYQNEPLGRVVPEFLY